MRSSRRGGGAAFGIVLIVLGTLLLLERLDLIDPFIMRSVWDYWPLLFVAWGLFRIVQAESPRRVGGGVTTLGFGLWFMVSEFHWMGLTWRDSWPLVFVAIGSGIIVRTLLERTWKPSSGAEEVHDEHC